MKCIKAIKSGKYQEVGDIKRTDDLEAHQKVGSGYWEFIPKSEWKKYNRSSKEEVKEEVKESYETNNKLKVKKQKNEKNIKKTGLVL